MTPPEPSPSGQAFIEEFRAAVQADEDDEAVYGWMVDSTEVSGVDVLGERVNPEAE